MTRFWKHRDEDPVDRLLRENRPAPRDEFLSTIVSRVRSSGSPLRRGTPVRRVVLATLVTALAVTLAGLMGGITGAAAGVGSLIHVATQTVSPSHSSSNQSSTNTNGTVGTTSSNDDESGDDNGEDADHHQYKVTICHWADHKYVTITVSQQGAAEHKAHHPHDIVPAPPGGCPIS